LFLQREIRQRSELVGPQLGPGFGAPRAPATAVVRWSAGMSQLSAAGERKRSHAARDQAEAAVGVNHQTWDFP
jgi:hypothetical protein